MSVKEARRLRPRTIRDATLAFRFASWQRHRIADLKRFIIAEVMPGEVAVIDDERVRFLMHLRPELVDEYLEAHRTVWPEMLDALRRHGWRDSHSLSASGTVWSSAS